jgi:adenylate cyclase
MATISATDNHSNVAARITARIERAFHQEEIDGLRLAARVRAVAMIAIAIWLFSLMGTFAWYYMPFLAVFILTAFANYGLAKSSYGRAWQTFALHAFDVGLLTFILLVPNPLLVSAVDYQWPLATQFRFENFLWYFVLIALAALGSYSPRVLLWVGAVSIIAWSIGFFWVMMMPDTVTGAPTFGNSRERLERFLDPNFLSTNLRLQEAVAMMIVASILAVTAWRARKMATREIMASRGRTNLARYFPPNMVDQLAEADNPFGEVRSQSVAVLFADIVGFTQMAEQVSPREIVEMLRAYHRRTERLVFENNGTLDKFLGDGVMATFGNPIEGAHDAGDALACARALIAEADDWNKRREASGFPAVRLSVGVHFGPVVRGDIGTERRLEYAVLGDTVNVTSRLEELTRDLHCAIAASDALVAKVRASGDPRADDLLAGFVKGEPQRLRGREALTEFWTYGSDAQF